MIIYVIFVSSNSHVRGLNDQEVTVSKNEKQNKFVQTDTDIAVEQRTSVIDNTTKDANETNAASIDASTGTTGGTTVTVTKNTDASSTDVVSTDAASTGTAAKAAAIIAETTKAASTDVASTDTATRDAITSDASTTDAATTGAATADAATTRTAARAVVTVDNTTTTWQNETKRADTTIAGMRMHVTTSRIQEQLESGQVTFHICCGVHQRLNKISNGCVNTNKTDLNKIGFLLDNYVVDKDMKHEVLSSVQFTYGHEVPNRCTRDGLLRKY